MLPRFHWAEKKCDTQSASSLAKELELPLPLARILINRKCHTATKAQRFLNPSLTEELSNPDDFPGITHAAKIIWHTIRNQGHIVVFGDFDVDGVAATAILVTSINRLGGSASPFIPERGSEGYGLSIPALQRCIRELGKPPQLLVTVDCGINSVTECEWLTSQGVEVVITDHHEPDDQLPQASVLVNPKLNGTPEGASDLCGAGVAFKLSHALVNMGREQGWYQGAPLGGELLATAGVATVADVVPLTGENRVLVYAAIRHWQRYASEGLKALLNRAARQTADNPDAFTFSFILGPRINAAGRMGTAATAYELLTTSCPDRAAFLAAELEGCNAERRSIEARLLAAARAQCGLDQPDATTPRKFTAPAVVVGGLREASREQGWHPGVIGIVAARLLDLTGVPVAVATLDEHGSGRGSVRAGPGYHAVRALSQAAEALTGYGGHAQAAGFQIKPGCFNLFKELFEKACASQRPADPIPELFDGWLEPDNLTLDFYHAQQQLAPFGYANPTPRWALSGATLCRAQPMGSSGDHLQLHFAMPNNTRLRAIWFRHGHLIEFLRNSPPHYNIIFELQLNRWRGQDSIELLIADMIPQTL